MRTLKTDGTVKNLHNEIQVFTLWKNYSVRQLKKKSQNTYSYKYFSLVYLFILRFF